VFVTARTRSLPIRLLGVQLSNLGMFEQLSLFDRNERIGAVVDSIRARFGFATVSLATARGQPRGSARSRGGRSQNRLLHRILDRLARILHAFDDALDLAFGFVALTFVLEVLVAGESADGLLDLPLGLVDDLAHCSSPSRYGFNVRTRDRGLARQLVASSGRAHANSFAGG